MRTGNISSLWELRSVDPYMSKLDKQTALPRRRMFRDSVPIEPSEIREFVRGLNKKRKAKKAKVKR